MLPAVTLPDPWPALFQIGVKPLGDAPWLDVDDRLQAHLGEKARLAAAHPDEVFVAEAGTEAAQEEVLRLVADHVAAAFPAIYRRREAELEIVPAGRRVRLDKSDVPALAVAGSLVQEDLILMRRGDTGWRLAAGSLSFPSSWRLREKFGLPMQEVHAPVPGFGAGTRNAELINRMFDHLRPDVPIIRWNWSLYGDEALYHPEAASPDARQFGPDAQRIFVRLERQTLRRLPVSGDILFTIRIYVDPLDAVARQPEAGRVATALAEQLAGLDDAQLAYKGMRAERDAVLARLRAVAG